MAQEQAQSDPWAEASRGYKPQEGPGQAAPAASDDWKVWQQGGQDADNRNSIQKSFDENTADNPNDPFLKSLLKSAVRTPLQPLMHPLKALSYDPATAGLPTNQPQPQGGGVMHDIANTVGGTVGMAGLMGGANAALDSLPSTARAGARFNALNTKLANEPVPLNATAAPLQRAAEIGARGEALPKALNDLLTRSQSPIPMTYPEARDYQSSLVSRSLMDRLNTSPRMAGATKQLNKAMFSDIRNAADAQGLGEDYEKATNEYRQAATLRKLGKNAAVGAGLGAAGAVGAGPIVRALKNLVP
jgi:hypothetical protein